MARQSLGIVAWHDSFVEDQSDIADVQACSDASGPLAG
jgi:hypothetical protein